MRIWKVCWYGKIIKSEDEKRVGTNKNLKFAGFKLGEKFVLEMYLVDEWFDEERNNE